MAAEGFAVLPDPPYWSVAFTSRRVGHHDPADDEEYRRAAARMEELAAAVPGYLGIESVRDGDGLGITVSYWDGPEAIARWRRDVAHVAVQEAGRTRWYEHLELRIARVERAYGWDVLTGWR